MDPRELCQVKRSNLKCYVLYDLVMILMFVFPQNLYAEDFPCGMVGENPPSNTKGMGLIPGPERCAPFMCGGTAVCSLHTRAYAPQQEMPPL